MDADKIHQLLTDLHRELADAEALPAELADEARAVVEDLTKATPQPGGEGHDSAVDRLEEFATHFETDHPKLATAARQVALALSRMGI